jgi:hypothetical protein
MLAWRSWSDRDNGQGEAPGGPGRGRGVYGEPPGASTERDRAEVDMAPDGDGTVLRLRHSGLVRAVVAGHVEGWDSFLGRLTTAATAA